MLHGSEGDESNNCPRNIHLSIKAMGMLTGKAGRSQKQGRAREKEQVPEKLKRRAHGGICTRNQRQYLLV